MTPRASSYLMMESPALQHLMNLLEGRDSNQGVTKIDTQEPSVALKIEMIPTVRQPLTCSAL